MDVVKRAGTVRRIVVCVLFLSTFAMGAALAKGTGQIEICHFQEGTGGWRKLMIGESAAPAHLGDHDDAVPGGVTPRTLTSLNAACRAPLPGCRDCLVVKRDVGCELEACEAVVCEEDPFCCEVEWDFICVAEALSDCVDVCVIPADFSSCCVATAELGCGDDTCEATVCAEDPYCCEVGWDGICAGEAFEDCPGLCEVD